MFKIPVLGLNLSPRDQPSLSEASAGDRAHAVGPRCLDDAWSVELDFREGQQLGELIFQESQVGKDLKPNTLWSSNVAMENPPFIEYGPFKTRISKISDCYA